jgi:hypothetical protein
MPALINDRLLVEREYACHVTSVEAYWLARSIINISISVAQIIVYCSVVYYFVGLRTPFANYLFFVYIFVVTDIISYFMMQTIAGFAPTLEVAMSLVVMVISMTTTFAGYLIYIPAFPSWLSWATNLTYVRYAFEALVINEMKDNSDLPLAFYYLDELSFETRTAAECAVMLWVFVAIHGFLSYLMLKTVNYIRR